VQRERGRRTWLHDLSSYKKKIFDNQDRDLNKKLLVAVKKNQLDVVKEQVVKLSGMGKRPNAPLDGLQTALDLAEPDSPVENLLVRAGARTREEQYRIAKYRTAASKGDVSAILDALRKHPIARLREERIAALDLAKQNGHLAAAVLLGGSHAGVPASTVALEMVALPDENKKQNMLEQFGHDFQKLCRNGDVEAAKKLFAVVGKAAGIDIKSDIMQSKHGRTPLHGIKDDTEGAEVVDWLVEMGAVVNARDNDGCTPLNALMKNCVRGSKASSRRRTTLDALLSHGAKLDEPDKKGYMPLHYAVLNRNLGAVKTLIRSGANPDVPTEYKGILPVRMVNLTRSGANPDGTAKIKGMSAARMLNLSNMTEMDFDILSELVKDHWRRTNKYKELFKYENGKGQWLEGRIEDLHWRFYQDEIFEKNRGHRGHALARANNLKEIVMLDKHWLLSKDKNGANALHYAIAGDALDVFYYLIRYVDEFALENLTDDDWEACRQLARNFKGNFGRREANNIFSLIEALDVARTIRLEVKRATRGGTSAAPVLPRTPRFARPSGTPQ
jgi:ankyrin repeat protein